MLTGQGREPFIAGIYDPRPGSAEARREELAAALHDGAAPTVGGAGPLAVALRGAGDAARSRPELPFCALEGTVYNLDEVADGMGIAPRGEPPETTLARAYSRLGDEVVARLRGDFTLVLWDRNAESGLVARDHLGGRGLVWSALGGRLLFASDVRYLLPLLPSTPGPDLAALAHWAATSGMPGEHSLYEGVRRLPPAHLLRLDGGAWEVRRYWAPRYRRPLRAPRAELVERLRAVLQQAVDRRCGPGGDTGLLLSGGLDSSTVGAFAARVAADRRPQRAYSAVFPEHPSVDEAEQIDTLCSAFGLTGVRAAVRSGSVLSGALPYLEHWRLPPVSPNLFFWRPLLERAAADGTASILTGEGGDELFGLPPALIADRLRRGRILAARGLLHRMPSSNGRPTREAIRRAGPMILREHGVKAALPAGVHRAVRALRGAERYAPDWFSEATARAYVDSHDVTAWKRADGPRWWAQLVGFTTSGMGPSQVYDHSRRRSALAGITARHPLVDVDVIELVLTFPPELAFDQRHTRPMIREALVGLMPDEVRLRPTKSSFDAVFHESLADRDLPVARRLLSSPDTELAAYIDLAAVRGRLLDGGPPSHPIARARWAVHLWRLMTLECWLRTLVDPAFPGRLAEEAGLPEADVRLASGVAA